MSIEIKENNENPNGANQYTSDPREQTCWNLYVESINKGTENAYQAAIEAGYSEDHSRNITLQGWFKERIEKLKRKELVSKAEKVFEKTLDYDTEIKDNKGNIKTDTNLLRVQTDVAKFIAQTQGKNEGYNNTPELKEGDAVMIIFNNVKTN